MDPGARFKRGMRGVYDAADERYERYIMPTFEPIARRVVELANPTPEERHLDLATGTGLVLRLLDRSVTDKRRRTIGLDLSASMLRRARAGTPTARFVQADLERLPIDTGVVDVVTLTLALHHLPEPHAALAEARRALRPGGRLAVAAWTTHMSELWQGFDRWFEAAGLGESRPAQQSRRAIDTPEVFRAALAEAGFAQSEVERGRVELPFADLGAFWEWRVSFAATNRALSALPAEDRARLRADCLATLAPLVGSGEVRADQDVMFALASVRRP